jgi:hypothetical protein
VPHDRMTSELLARLADPAADRRASLDTFLSLLLAECLGWSGRATDGFLILREEVAPGAYFAVGTLYLIDDQSRQPVVAELRWSAEAVSLERGVVRVGMAAASKSKYGTYDKVENALLAWPHETARDLPWEHSLEWVNGEWRCAQSEEQRC